MRTSILFTALLAALQLPLAAAAQEKFTEHTFKLGADGKPGAASISDMAWLAGGWTGNAFSGHADEVWSAPKDGVMMCMYRLVRDGRVVFYEFVTLGEENGSLMIRIKHFDARLKGWEEKDKSVEFPFVMKADGAMYFEGMTFRPEKDGSLTVFLVVAEKGGQNREVEFHYTRVPGS
jgi:hypothetical protein